MPLPEQLALETPQRLDRHRMPLPQQSAPGTPQRRTRQEEQDQPSDHTRNAGLQSDGRQVRYAHALASQYCRPGGQAIANHQIHHNVLNDMSRRRAILLCTRVHPSQCTGPVLDNPSRSTDCEPINHRQCVDEDCVPEERKGTTGGLSSNGLVWKSMSSVGDAEHDPRSIRPRRGFFCGVKPAGRTSEPFDGLSARIFCAG